VRLLRTLPARRLALLLLALASIAAAAAAITVTASGGGGATPPAKPLARAVHDALAAPQPEGITARIRFTNRLFPSGALLGNIGSALMSGGSGRLWVTNDGRGRLELQSNAGDVQVVWNREHVTVYDAFSNTVYQADLPKHGQNTGAAPSVGEIAKALTGLREHVSVSGAEPADVAGRAAYRVTVSPKHDGGLLGSAQLAWDAVRGVPLDVAILAQGSSSPVLELKVTGISYGPIPAGDVAVAPPHGAKTVSLGAGASKAAHEGKAAKAAVGLKATRAAAGFPVVAPSTLVGLPRRDVRAIGRGSKTVLVAYGRGLGGIVVVERRTGPRAGAGGMLSSLPKVSVDGLTAHELATQLGTALQWRRAGVEYVLAGSVPAAAAEAAARDLR